MVWIKGKKNGNAFEFNDDTGIEALLAQGHEAYTSDPRVKGAKRWFPDDDADGAAETDDEK